MTIKEILEDGYGIDFSTLKFDIQKDAVACTKEEIIESLTNDELIIDGEIVTDFDIYSDKPNGYIELYCD